MPSYYTPKSAEFVGTRRSPVCGLSSILPSGNERVRCAGEVRFIFTHSGFGDYEATACDAWLARAAELGVRAMPRVSGYEHALYRDGDGIWQLRDDAELIA